MLGDANVADVNKSKSLDLIISYIFNSITLLEWLLISVLSAFYWLIFFFTICVNFLAWQLKHNPHTSNWFPMYFSCSLNYIILTDIENMFKSTLWKTLLFYEGSLIVCDIWKQCMLQYNIICWLPCWMIILKCRL